MAANAVNTRLAIDFCVLEENNGMSFMVYNYINFYLAFILRHIDNFIQVDILIELILKYNVYIIELCSEVDGYWHNLVVLVYLYKILDKKNTAIM